MFCHFLTHMTALSDDGKFLLAARKCKRPTYTDYIISLHAEDLSKGSSTYVGKLRYARSWRLVMPLLDLYFRVYF